MTSRGARLALAAGALVAAGCASECRAMQDDRAAFFAQPLRARGPHARVIVPMAVGDRLLAARLAAAPMGAGVALPGRIGALVGRQRVDVTRISLVPAAPDRLGLRVELAVGDGRARLLELDAVVALHPEVDLTTGRLVLALRPGDLRALSATPGPGAVDQLAAALRARLPPAAAAVVPPHELAAAAAAIVGRLSGELGALLAESGALDGLGAVARIAVDLPVVPVTRFEVRSWDAAAGRGPPAVEIAVYTALPSAAEVPGGEAAGERVRVLIAAPAAVEQVNALFASGRIPSRYDQEMRARDDGELTPGLRWRTGPKPLAIYVWRRGGHCFRARIGARPVLAVEDGRLRAGIEDGELEEVEGALLVRARVWSKRIGEDAIAATREVVAAARVTVGGVALAGRLVAARIAGDLILAELDVEAAPAPQGTTVPTAKSYTSGSVLTSFPPPTHCAAVAPTARKSPMLPLP